MHYWFLIKTIIIIIIIIIIIKKTNWGVFLELPDYVIVKPSIYHLSIVVTSTKFFSVNFAPNRYEKSFKMA